MFALPSIRLGRLFGIPVEVNASWFAVFALITALLGFTYYPTEFPGRPLWIDLTSGVVTALMFFASLVIHELSHSLVARAGGIRISKITLFIFGGVAQMEEEPKTAGREALMALAGPGMSLLLSAAFYLTFAALARNGVSDVWWAPLQYLALINFAVALFNLMPGFPLDGGRVLRATIWAISRNLLLATRWASRAGQFIGYAFVALALWGAVAPSLGYTGVASTDFLWLGLVGWFIATIARRSYEQQIVKSSLSDVTVGSVMSRAPVLVPADITLEQLAHDYFLGQRHSRYPVRGDEGIVGIITLAEAKSVPRSRWDDVRVADIANRDLTRLVVSQAQPLQDVLERLGADEPGALLVVDGGRLEGIVTRSDVIRQLRVAEATRR